MKHGDEMNQARKLDYETPVEKNRSKIFTRNRIIAGGMFAMYGSLAVLAGYVLVAKVKQSSGFTLAAIGFIFILCLFVQFCLWQAAAMISRIAQ